MNQCVSAPRISFATVLLATLTSVAGAQSFKVEGAYGNVEGCNLAMGRSIVNESIAMLRSGEFYYYSTDACSNVQLAVGQNGAYVLTADCEMSKTRTFYLEPLPDRSGFMLNGTDYGNNEYMNYCR